MSRKKDNYENSLWLKFKKWIDGETDLLKGTYAGGAVSTGGASGR